MPSHRLMAYANFRCIVNSIPTSVRLTSNMAAHPIVCMFYV